MTNAVYRPITRTIEPTAEIPFDKLPAVGAPGHLTVLAIKENDLRDDQSRLTDRSLRWFLVRLLLVKNISFPANLNTAFTAADGASFVGFPEGTVAIKVSTSLGEFEVELNDRHEMSLIRMRVEAHEPVEARNKVYDASSAFLDHLAFAAHTPILSGMMEIFDEKNEANIVDMIGPERSVVVTNISVRLHQSLAPVYALYREFKNSQSAYYRLLCLFKIMEGILGPLRKEARLLAKKCNLTLDLPKEVVPYHPHIAPDLQKLIGLPIKEFYDTIVYKQYRNLVSHFLVKEHSILKVSSAADRARFTEMTFLCDLCVRNLINNHEELVRRLAELETGSH
jgi:hypothetical protein